MHPVPPSLFRLICSFRHRNLTAFDYTQRRKSVSKRAPFRTRQIGWELAAEGCQCFCLDLAGALS
jgi:hypothetical protein